MQNEDMQSIDSIHTGWDNDIEQEILYIMSSLVKNDVSFRFCAALDTQTACMTLLNIHYLICKKWSEKKKQTTWSSFAAPGKRLCMAPGLPILTLAA